jgi:hypothetical protein
MSSLERRLTRVADAIKDRNSGCTCDGQGSLFVVRYVGAGDPVQGSTKSAEREDLCTQHPPRLRFERFDQARGAWVESDPKVKPSS